MPCDTITMQTVSLSNALPDVLTDALQSTGWTIRETTSQRIIAYKGSESVTWSAGKGLSVRSSNPKEVIRTVTQAYSRQAVSWAAKRAGWTVRQTNENQFTVTRR